MKLQKEPPTVGFLHEAAFFSHQPGRFWDQVGIGSQVVGQPKVHSHARKQWNPKQALWKRKNVYQLTTKFGICKLVFEGVSVINRIVTNKICTRPLDRI